MPSIARSCKRRAIRLRSISQPSISREPVIPVIGNTDATPLDTATVRQRLVDHLTHPVRFQQSVEALRAQGDTFIEVGFGGVLSGLVRRIDKEATRAAAQDRPSFEELEESWRKSDE